MRLEDVIALLTDYRGRTGDALGIRALGVFGSTARGDADAESDVDIVVDLAVPSYAAYTHIKHDLEERLGRSVDLVRKRQTMNPLLRRCIDEEAVYA